MAEVLSQTDILRLRKAMAHVRADSFFTCFKRLLRARIRFHTFLMMRFDQDAPPELLGSWILRDALPQNVLEQYVDGAYRLDPFFQFRDLPDNGALFRLSDIAPDRFFSSEYFLHYYRQTRLCDEIGLLAPLPSGSIAHLSFSRLEHAGPFRRRELQCLKHYSPLLLELLGTHCSYRQKHDRQKAAETQARPLNETIHAQVNQTLKAGLTRREAQIAGLVLQGHSNGSAALILGISRETSKVHRRNLYRKLNISSQGELFTMLKHLL